MALSVALALAGVELWRARLACRNTYSLLVETGRYKRFTMRSLVSIYQRSHGGSCGSCVSLSGSYTSSRWLVSAWLAEVALA